MAAHVVTQEAERRDARDVNDRSEHVLKQLVPLNEGQPQQPQGPPHELLVDGEPHDVRVERNDRGGSAALDPDDPGHDRSSQYDDQDGKGAGERGRPGTGVAGPGPPGRDARLHPAACEQPEGERRDHGDDDESGNHALGGEHDVFRFEHTDGHPTLLLCY